MANQQENIDLALEQIEKVIAETGEGGTAIILKAIQMKIDLLGLVTTQAPASGSAPAGKSEPGFDPAYEAAMKDPKLRARAQSFERAIIRAASKKGER